MDKRWIQKVQSTCQRVQSSWILIRYVFFSTIRFTLLIRRRQTHTHNNDKTGFNRNNFRSQIRKQPSIQEKKFNVVPLGDVPPELVKHLEMRNPSGFVYTVPESSQTVEFWEGVKNKPPSSINILEEIQSS